MLILESALLDGRTGHDAGRALLRQLYCRHFPEEMPPICTTPRGKPYFADSPIHFSISHTHRRVFVALSDVPIGIDAEETDRTVRLDLAQKILSPAEKVQFEAAEDQRMALLTFWVLKEAAAKCSGEGLRGYPNQTNFSLSDRRVTQVNGCLLAVITEEL
jgi:4'-phosphopantetheinyl transferase